MKTNENPVSARAALLGSVAFLSGIGILAIYASSSISADQIYNDSFFYVKKQASTLLIGFVMIFGMGYLPMSWLRKLPLPLFIGSIILLIMTLFPPFAHSAKGATRWIRLPPGITFQPAEIAKIALIFFIAKNISIGKTDIKSWTAIGGNMAVFGVIGALLMLQPDFGTTFLLFSVVFLMLYAGGMSKKHIGLFAATGFTGACAAIAAAPYRMKRLLTFLDPWQEAYKGGFQIIQSYVGFQNGGVFGLGLGESKQKLFFLPDAHTDFILAVIGEELGMFGVLLVCAIFAYLTFLCARITMSQKDDFSKFLAFGITVLIASQACLNMGVAMGLLPTKGIPLPFVSNGRSSLIVFLFCIGILCRLSQSPEKKSSPAAS